MNTPAKAFRKHLSSAAFLVVLLTILGFRGVGTRDTHRRPGKEGPKAAGQLVSRETRSLWKYNDLYRKACHNCYEKQYAASLDEALTYTPNLEIDFYDSELIGTSLGARPGKWYVRHKSFGANNNCATGQNGSAGNLADCFKNIVQWSDCHPNHEVITVFLDKKQAWGPGRSPADLDKLILATLPANKLYRPADLQQGYATLRQAANANAWPTLGGLRGKIILVLTGGQLFNHNRTLNEYLRERKEQAALFVAADTDESSDVAGWPQQFGPEEANQLVFYNIKFGHEAIASTIHEHGYLSRVWNAPEDDLTYRKLIDQNVQFIALNNFRNEGFNEGSMEGSLPPEGKKIWQYAHQPTWRSPSGR